MTSTVGIRTMDVLTGSSNHRTMEIPSQHGTRSNHTPSASISTTDHTDYFGSLIPPSTDDFNRIASTQERREKEYRRRSPEHHLLPLEIPAAEPAAPNNTPQRTDHHSGRIPDARRDPEDDESEHRRIIYAASLIQRTYRQYRTRQGTERPGLSPSTRWQSALQDARYRALTSVPAPSNPHTHYTPSSSDAQSDTHPTDTTNPSETARKNWKKLTGVVLHAVSDADPVSEQGPSSSSSLSLRSASTPRAPEPRTRAFPKTSHRRAGSSCHRKADPRRNPTRVMDLQYFLEMVDVKHRYGFNLRVYHEVWRRADTHENFFFWLDSGSGRALDLPSCPRERLQRERVRYLSREERQYYLVEIDSEGRLCWAKNGTRINTTEEYRDSIHGIVPLDDPASPPLRPSTSECVTPVSDGIQILRSPPRTPTSMSSTLRPAPETDITAKYPHPVPESVDSTTYPRAFPHLSPTYLLTSLLRASMGPNTWLFVADTNFRLYVGLKSSGDFQHSSFLQGARVSAAGLIDIREGRLVSLSPLSGHYRPPASSYRAFLKNLRAEGVDTRRLRPSKAYFALIGLETYTQTKGVARKIADKMNWRKRRESGEKGHGELRKRPVGKSGTRDSTYSASHKHL